MKKILSSLGWILLLLPLINIALARAAFAKTDSADTETRNVSDFTGIASSGAFEVYVNFGNKESLRLEGKKGKFRKS